MTAYMTPQDLAHRWSRRVEWVQQNAPRFGGIKIGGYWRFDPADVEAYEARQKAMYAPADPLALSPLSAKRQAS